MIEPNRITAGLPGLLPGMRAGVDTFWKNRDTLRSTQKDAKQRAMAAVAPDGDRPTHIPEAQKGIELHSTILIRRLLQLNPRFHFEVARADSTKMGVYYFDAFGVKRFIAGFERENNPEFETRLRRPNGEIDKTIRGYRTVLSRLIRRGFITEARCNALFGPPSRDSKNWMIATT